jgi:hypothetical protein
MPRVGFEPTIPVFEREKILLIEILRQNYVKNNCIILAERSYRQECSVKITGRKQQVEIYIGREAIIHSYNALTFKLFVQYKPQTGTLCKLISPFLLDLSVWQSSCTAFPRSISCTRRDVWAVYVAD